MQQEAEQTILVADDDQAVRFVLEQALSRAGYKVHAFGNTQPLVNHFNQYGGDLIITDVVMPGGSGLDMVQSLKATYPDLPIIVMTAQSTLRNAVQAFERGAFEYLAKPFDINRLVDLTRRALQKQEERVRNQPQTKTKQQAAAEDMDRQLEERFGGIIGSSRAMQALFHTIGRLSNSEMTVLIHGESGTGKELVARAVHAYSPRRRGPFTAINMAAIPRDLIESELFGHEKGAFTGAVSRRPGHFQKAEGGTLFLDEIGDMPMEAQTRLLRVLQEGTFTLVGSTDILRSDVRIIAATHQDLPTAISEGRFREDLFYRLNVIPLHVPTLRSRKEDIPVLSQYFLAKTSKELKVATKRLTQSAMEKLVAYDWPGNVRELENLIRRLTVLIPEDEIRPEKIELYERTMPKLARNDLSGHEPQEERSTESNTSHSYEAILLQDLDTFFATMGGLETSGVYDMVLRKMEAVLIPRVLRQTRGNRVKAAQILGINRNTLRKKMRDLGMDD
ncbi:nitrogen metabolism transcriptional regulator, NtrC, Fis Family [Magnetococcus marinus MC-1]|uniref:DNA-binding transcriptional regulator NtrC n=1 Tax=Magnetococcus marinus (strain ATCC BAA-1437 / JCM 17883 / MC-1) TaxID=156889 RepID=A0LDW4_MAGMM|nr:nitrogen regulation protein NR(I) [Magnetococcus marinus]ABK46157.1 nitrogen metabolism transcriptional regulator, NtrC, Fis Family [Magnetococcus marinus MC-1]